jgi:hypothetical protein
MITLEMEAIVVPHIKSGRISDRRHYSLFLMSLSAHGDRSEEGGSVGETETAPNDPFLRRVTIKGTSDFRLAAEFNSMEARWSVA